MLEQRITGANSLPSIVPDITPLELIKQLLPPPEFTKARFESYRPDANFPSQQAAVESAKQFVTGKRAKLDGIDGSKVEAFADAGRLGPPALSASRLPPL